jgi:hypothetical protein
MRTMLFLIALMASAIYNPIGLYAHDWYPSECCGGMDCGPIVHITMLPDGNRQITITNRVGVEISAVFPKDFPIRQSPDGKEHACVGYMKKPLCLYSNLQI